MSAIFKKGAKNMNIEMMNDSFDIWKKIIRSFVRPGDDFEIRCWEDENTDFAAKWSNLSTVEGLEKVFSGKVSNPMLKALCAEPKGEKGITDIFTISFTSGEFLLFSEHYGSELHLLNLDKADEARLKECGASDYFVY